MPDGSVERTITVDGLPYKVRASPDYTQNELNETVRQIKASAGHQSALASRKSQIASHNADVLAERAKIGPQYLQPVKTDASGAVVDGLKGKSFQQLQSERFANEFHTTPEEGQRIAFDVQSKGYDKASQDANRRAANVRDAQTVATLKGQNGVGNAVKTAVGLPFEEIDRNISRAVTGKDYDTVAGADFVEKYNPLLDSARKAAEGPHGNAASRIATGLVTGMATPSGAAALLVGPALKGIGGLAGAAGEEGSALAEIAQASKGAADVVHKANTGVLGASVAASLPDLVTNPAKFAEENAANLAFWAAGKVGSRGAEAPSPTILEAPTADSGTGNIPALQALAQKLKLYREHPVSGGGVRADVQRAITDPLAETKELAPNTYNAAHELSGARGLAAIAVKQTKDAITQILGGEKEAQWFLDVMDENRRRGHEAYYRRMAQNAQGGSLTPEQTVPVLQSIQGKAGLAEDLVDRYKENLLVQDLLDKKNAGQNLTPQAKAEVAAYEKRLKAGKTQRPSQVARMAFEDAADATKGRSAFQGYSGDYDNFVNSPEFQQAKAAWDRGMGMVYEQTHSQAGGDISEKLGDHGFFPGIGQTEKGKPAHWTPETTVNDQYRGNYRSTGLSDAYAPDWETLQRDLYRRVRTGAEQRLWETARAEGVAQDMGRFDVKPTVNADGYLEYTNPGTGEVVRGTMMDKGLRFVKDGNNIPPDAVFVPDWFRREVEPLVARTGEPDTALKGMVRALGGAAVAANPADLTSHFTNLVGALETQSPTSLTDNPLLKAVEYAPLPEIPIPGIGKTLSGRKMVAMHEMRRVDLKSVDSQAKILEMAKAGVLPDRYALPNETPSGVLGRIQSLSHNALYGMDIRSRIVMWDSIKRFERETGVPMSPEQRYEVMKTLGIYSQALSAGLERWQKQTGLNPFATAHFQQMRNGFAMWKTMVGIDERYKHLPTSQRLSAKMAAQFRGGPLKKALAWYLTAKVAQSIMNPQKGDEKFMRAGGAQVASPLARGPLGAAIAGGYNAAARGLSIPEGAALGASNTIMQTGLGNIPGAAFSAMSGKSPYLVQNDERGPDFISAMPKGVPNNAATRAYFGIIGLNQSAEFIDEHVRELLGVGNAK